jgi:hypothetical protein
VRSLLQTLAGRALAEPERAQELAGLAASLARRMQAEEGSLEPPPGYLYAGAHLLRARLRDLDVEPMPPAQGGIPIFTTGRVDPVEIRMPFDVWIYGVSGSAMPSFAGVDPDDLIGATLLSTAQDGRDLFTVDWQLDGGQAFSTDGRQRMMYPASVTVGTRLVPRPMSWFLQRNQVLGVRFRNMTNAIIPAPFLRLSECGIAFHAVNRNDP